MRNAYKRVYKHCRYTVVGSNFKKKDKMNRIINCTLIAFFVLSNMLGQSPRLTDFKTINQLENNKKQGMWRICDPTKKLIMTCEFKDDSIISDINYFLDSIQIMSLKKGKNSEELYVYRNNDIIECQMKKDGNKTSFVDRNNKEFDKELQDWLFEHISIQAAYIGGNAELLELIKSNIDLSRVKGKKGTVKIQFVIDENGYLINPKIVERSSKLLNDEALRVIKLIPRWQPGNQFGKFVKCLYTVPIVFN